MKRLLIPVLLGLGVLSACSTEPRVGDPVGHAMATANNLQNVYLAFMRRRPHRLLIHPHTNKLKETDS